MNPMSLMSWIRGISTTSILADLKLVPSPTRLQAGVQNAHVSASADARVCLLLSHAISLMDVPTNHQLCIRHTVHGSNHHTDLSMIYWCVGFTLFTLNHIRTLYTNIWLKPMSCMLKARSVVSAVP
jgi:hypothetical protein